MGDSGAVSGNEPDEQVLRCAFATVRPICVELTRDHSVENILKLSFALDHIDRLALVHLQDYILFPLHLLLKQSKVKSENIYVECVNCITKVLLVSDPFSQWTRFRDLFSTLCCLISVPNSELGVAPVCEELKLATVRCVDALLRRADRDVLTRLYEADSLTLVGHAVTLLLALAQNESMRELKKSSLGSLLRLILGDTDIVMSSSVQHPANGCDDLHSSKRTVNSRDPLIVACGDAFASFLPGVVTSLAKVIAGDEKQGQSVTCTSVKVWSRVVGLVLDDSGLVSEDSGTAIDSKKIEQNLIGRDSLDVKRTIKWACTTAEKLKILIDRLAPVGCHAHWKVRLEMMEMSENLLVNCARSLASSVPQLLNILIRGTTDDYRAVADTARHALARFQECRVGPDEPSLLNILEESIYHLATRLPRQMAAPDDSEKLSCICLLKGHLQLLGPNVDRLLSSSVHLQRLSSALMQILRFDCSSVQVIQERTAGTRESSLDTYSVTVRPKYQFKCFAEARIEAEIASVCRLLGYYGNPEILVDHFMELFRESTEYRKQATFCLNEIISGINTPPSGVDIAVKPILCSSQELETIIRSVIDEFLQPEYWDTDSPAPRVNPHQPCTSLLLQRPSIPLDTIERTNSSVILSCLLLEGVGRCATSMGAEFQCMLMTMLYPVLVTLGSERMRVSQCALLALKDIARAVACETVADVLRVNCDYVVNEVSMRLRDLSRNPEVLSVLSVVLRYGDKDILSLLVDTMSEILLALDTHYVDFTPQFLLVFKSLVQSVSVWYRAPPIKTTATPSVPQNVDVPRGTDDPPLVSYILEYHRNRLKAENFDDDENEGVQLDEDELRNCKERCEMEEDESEEGTGDGGGNDEEKSPDYVALVKQILDRCQHFLRTQDVRVQLLVLDIIGTSCTVMKPFQSELLPLVHKLWKPFVRRLTGGEHVVAMKALETLTLMVESAGDFMHQRIGSDVLPAVAGLLEKLAPTSIKVGPDYRFTAAFKLQLNLLKNVAELCHHAATEGKQLNTLLYACRPYLSARQPPQIQQACVEAFKVFIRVDADSVWLLLNDLYCTQNPIQPPVDSIPPIKMFGSTQRNEYTDNVVTLMTLLT